MLTDAQAPACTIAEMANAVASDGGRIPGLQDALKIDKAHSERNAHRLFNRYGLALRVPISMLHVPASSAEEYPIQLPYLRIGDYLQLLLKRYEEVLLGGLRVGSQSEDSCASFWSRYKTYHPQHALFSKVKEEDLRYCVPLFVHGDKGKNPSKIPGVRLVVRDSLGPSSNHAETYSI